MNKMPVPHVYVQECTVSGHVTPTLAEKPSFPTFQAFPVRVPLSGSSNIQCHTFTTFHTALAQLPSSGKSKWKSSKQSCQRNYPPQNMQPLPPPQMFFNAYPGGPILPHSPATPYESYYYSAQPYFPGNIYRPQLQTPPPPPLAPRPYVTITQFNYQPVGYSHTQSQPATNLVFGPPPRDRRCNGDSNCRYYSSHLATSQYDIDRAQSPSRIVEPPKLLFHDNPANDPNYMNTEQRNSNRNDLKSDSSTSFEFTIQPEQIVNSLCDEKEHDCIQCKKENYTNRVQEETAGNHSYGSPRMWTECEYMDPMRIEDDDLTKFIVDGCLKAEAIAVKNQHRPCFKNIKHLCTRTRTDILKPRTTVANIHSQGIPWATKDFIFAFIRLINCWYILKGYLDDHEGSLGKIETALIPEFKESYQRWQNINKEMIKHLINIFVNLDNGITVQNAEIFSSYNHGTKISSTCSLSCEEHNNDNKNKAVMSKSCPNKLNHQEHKEFYNQKYLSQNLDEQKETKNQEKLQNDPENESKINPTLNENVPGILRVKNIFNNPTDKNDEENNGERECKYHKIYMKPGSYRIPKKVLPTPTQSPRNSENDAAITSVPQKQINFGTQTPEQSPDEIWKTALETIGPFIKSVLKDSGLDLKIKSDIVEQLETTYKPSDNTQAWVNDQNFENNMEDNIEEVQDHKPATKTNRHSKNSIRKTIVSSKTFRKRNEDVEKVKNCKSVGEFISFSRTINKMFMPNIQHTKFKSHTESSHQI